jgi:hypothetical protein
MSENLMDSVAPLLAPPVTRDHVRRAAETEEGVAVSIMGIPVSAAGITVTFAEDDAE